MAALSWAPTPFEAQVDDPESHHDVADRELLVGEPGDGDHVAQEAEEVAVLLGPVLHGLFDGDVNFSPVSFTHVVLGRHALVQRDGDLCADAQGGFIEERNDQIARS